MSPTPRVSTVGRHAFPYIVLAPGLLASAFLISAPAGAETAYQAPGKFTCPFEEGQKVAFGTFQLDNFPVIFWDYIGTVYGVTRKDWDSPDAAKKRCGWAKEAYTLESEYEAKLQHLQSKLESAQSASADGGSTKSGAALDALVKESAAYRDSEVAAKVGGEAFFKKAAPQGIRPDDIPGVPLSGASYQGLFQAFEKEARGAKEQAALKTVGDRAKGMRESGSLKGAKGLEGTQAGGRQAALDKLYGERGGDAAGSGKADAGKIGGDGRMGGGQLRDDAAASARSKYGKAGTEPPPLETSLFAMKAAPSGLTEKGMVSTSYLPKASSRADRDLVMNDVNTLRTLPTGKALIDGDGSRKGVAQLTPELIPTVQKTGGGMSIMNLKNYAQDNAEGDYDTKDRPVPVYFPNRDLPGAAGGTFYDKKNNKTYIALSPSLKDSDEGVRLAVETEEMTHALQKEGMKNSGKEPLVPSAELEKAARFKALQVYDEYYKAHPEKTPPQNTDLEKELYSQHQLMLSDRKGLQQQMEQTYAGNTDGDNNRTLKQLSDQNEKENGAFYKIKWKVDQDRRISDATDYYNSTMKDNDDWLRQNGYSWSDR